ncbi:hypothetical protein HS7_05580 [Sulfolobales archaeon HS-7]|nr:hypothetical protein HS7_05580 [Sulfolobales archaeon HS-7]
MGFWEDYKIIEKAALIDEETFSTSPLVITDTVNATKRLLNEVLMKIKSYYGISTDDMHGMIFFLMKNKMINPELIGQLIDVIEFVNNIEGEKPEIIHSWLIRVMEILEEVYFSLSENKENTINKSTIGNI